MKKLVPVIVVVTIIAATAAILSFRSGGNDENATTAGPENAKVEVFYFHLTRRCVTCQAVENVTRDAVNEYYAGEISRGEVVFRSLNIEEKSSEAYAKRVNATGQCLMIVSGDKTIDLTSTGFMNARSNPEKLKEEIKKAIDPLLKEIKSN